MGDHKAQGKLVQEWYKRIYNFGYKFLLDHDLTMEVVQKTFIAMHKNISFLENTGKFKSWIYSIATNYCREEWRKRKTSLKVSISELNGTSSLQGWEATTKTNENPASKFNQKELVEILQSCLAELSIEQREVIIMKEYEGLKFREIAEALQIPESTAKTRMYYGLEALKLILAKRNINTETINYE